VKALVKVSDPSAALATTPTGRAPSTQRAGARLRAMPRPEVFVAYQYRFLKADYRRPFREIGKAYGVKFTYADERITNKQILEKIEAMIDDAELSLFDVTTWNANVALELGISMGKQLDYYILFNPNNDHGDVPADLGGIDRLQYTDYAELEAEVSRLMRQQFGAPVKERDAKARERGAQVTEHLAEISAEIPQIVRREQGSGSAGSRRAWVCPWKLRNRLCAIFSGREGCVPRA
jgi:hypothetical protein